MPGPTYRAQKLQKIAKRIGGKRNAYHPIKRYGVGPGSGRNRVEARATRLDKRGSRMQGNKAFIKRAWNQAKMRKKVDRAQSRLSR